MKRYVNNNKKKNKNYSKMQQKNKFVTKQNRRKFNKKCQTLKIGEVNIILNNLLL